MESDSQSLTQSHIFSSPTVRSKPVIFRQGSLERPLATQNDLRTLINNALMAKSQKLLSDLTSEPPKPRILGYLAPQLQDTMYITESKPKKREVQIKSMSVDKDTSRSAQLSLREKRLWDAKMYRTFHSRDSSNSLERTTTNFSKQSVGSSLQGKYQLAHIMNTETRPKKKKDGNSTFFGQIKIQAVHDSSNQSIDTISKDTDSTCRGLKSSNLLTAYSHTFEKIPTTRDDSKDLEDWKNYYSSAADPTFGSKIQTTSRRKRLGSANLESREKVEERNRSLYQKMMPTYAEFVKKNFDETMIERMDTFGAFAFTSVEKEENKGIPTFLNETKNKKESKGSMGVIDLWSSKLISELANQAGFVKEKKMIEKFAFYKSREKKENDYDNKKKPEFVILNRKNENIYKDMLVRKELVESHKKNEEKGLLRVIQRQRPLKGKSFYKSREKSTETPRTKNDMSEIKGGFADIMNNLKDFAEKNQDDYLKLLEKSASDKKIISNEKIRNIKKIERTRKL